MQLAVDMPRRKDVQEKKSTEKWNQLSADLKQDLKEDDCGRTGCCAGYFYHGEYAVTENGLKIELLQNGSAVTSNAFPFQVSLEHMRISSDRTFAVGVFWWYDYTSQLYGSSRFYRLDLMTGNLIAIAGLGTLGGSSCCKGDIDGPGANSTLDVLISDVALSPDGSFALVVGWYSGTVRKINVSSGFVTTITQVFTTGVDIAPDGSFAVLIDYTTLSKIDLLTNEITFLASIDGPWRFGPKVRISPDALFLVFFSGCEVYQLFLDASTPILIAGGEPSASGSCSGYSDGPGNSSQFGDIDDVAMSNTGLFVLLFDVGDWYDGSQGVSKVRRIDLRSMQVSTLVSGQILRPNTDAYVSFWGSLSITGSCDLCPSGSYSALSGSHSIY